MIGSWKKVTCSIYGTSPPQPSFWKFWKIYSCSRHGSRAILLMLHHVMKIRLDQPAPLQPPCPFRQRYPLTTKSPMFLEHTPQRMNLMSSLRTPPQLRNYGVGFQSTKGCLSDGSSWCARYDQFLDHYLTLPRTSLGTWRMKYRWSCHFRWGGKHNFVSTIFTNGHHQSSLPRRRRSSRFSGTSRVHAIYSRIVFGRCLTGRYR